MSSKTGSRRLHPAGDKPDRAVIDIGSNTVRLVIYSGSRRSPDVWLNEKVSARLGRDLAATGRMPDKAIQAALAALGRYATIVSDIEIADVQTVATAAVRDAENGPEFLEQVRALGLSPRLLSGEEEAFASAFGVIGAFPGALGTVADLGGGSLELVMIESGDCHDGVSLPLGTLRLPALREGGSTGFREAVAQEMAKAGWAAAHPGPLYMVGGTWRALATFALRSDMHPLSDPHGFCLDVEAADRIAKKVSRLTPEELSAIPGISSSRAAGLPDAAAMLRVMLAELQPEGVVFSSWGLREGLLFQKLAPIARGQDPLHAAIAHFTIPRGGSATLAAMIAAWIADAAPASDAAGQRLRLAATMLSLAAARTEPNLRLQQSYAWAVDKRWVGIDFAERARLAVAVRAACGKPALPEGLLTVADEPSLRQAAAWGLAIRLCRRLGGGSRVSVLTSSLRREEDKLVLWIDESRAQLATDSVASDLKALAQWLDLDHEMRIGEPAAPSIVSG